MKNPVIHNLIVSAGRFFARLLPLAGAYFLLDLFVVLQIRPEEAFGVIFSFFWAMLFASVALILPQLGGRIFFGVTYALFLAWSLTQSGYYADTKAIPEI